MKLLLKHARLLLSTRCFRIDYFTAVDVCYKLVKQIYIHINQLTVMNYNHQVHYQNYNKNSKYYLSALAIKIQLKITEIFYNLDQHNRCFNLFSQMKDARWLLRLQAELQFYVVCQFLFCICQIKLILFQFFKQAKVFYSSYLSAAIAVSDLLVSMYRMMPAKVGLSLGLRSQHCIMSMQTSGGHAFGAVRRCPSRIMSRRISEPFNPE